MTRIVAAFPPNIDEIRARFAVRPGTIFAYDGVIYSPAGTDLPGHLVVHEETHFAQQRAAGGAEAWWRRYIDDPGFRLEQEVEAYRAQFAVIRQLPRAERRELLARICKDLASGMYGSLVTKAEARRLVVA